MRFVGSASDVFGRSSKGTQILPPHLFLLFSTVTGLPYWAKHCSTRLRFGDHALHSILVSRRLAASCLACIRVPNQLHGKMPILSRLVSHTGTNSPSMGCLISTHCPNPITLSRAVSIAMASASSECMHRSLGHMATENVHVGPP